MPTAQLVGGAAGRRKTPSLSNLYSAPYLMWDGRAPDLPSQVLLPLETSSELHTDWAGALSALSRFPETQRFLAATGQRRISKADVIAALAAYVRSLITLDSPFDRYFFGGENDAITSQAKRGLALFIGRAGCSSCHQVSGSFALFTDYAFHSVGIGFRGGHYSDAGRFEITRDPSDLGAFKTPTLRNVALRAPYMHDGSISTLREVVEYYDRGGEGAAQNIDRKVRPLGLTKEEREELVAFLESLTSPIAIFEPDGQS